MARKIKPQQLSAELEIPEWRLRELEREEKYRQIIYRKQLLRKHGIEEDPRPQMRFVANLD